MTENRMDILKQLYEARKKFPPTGWVALRKIKDAHNNNEALFFDVIVLEELNLIERDGPNMTNSDLNDDLSDASGTKYRIAIAGINEVEKS